jgi:hypothetical protein
MPLPPVYSVVLDADHVNREKPAARRAMLLWWRRIRVIFVAREERVGVVDVRSCANVAAFGAPALLF